MTVLRLQHLDGSFRQVVWVAQLGCDIESEVFGVLDDILTHLDEQLPTLLVCLLQQHLCRSY